MTQPIPPEMDYESRFFPFCQDGPLPPGISPQTIKEAFERVGLSASKILKILGISPGVTRPEVKLRGILDKEEFRRRLKKEHVPGTQVALDPASILSFYAHTGKAQPIIRWIAKAVHKNQAGTSVTEMLRWHIQMLPSMLNHAAEIDGLPPPFPTTDVPTDWIFSASSEAGLAPGPSAIPSNSLPASMVFGPPSISSPAAPPAAEKAGDGPTPSDSREVIPPGSAEEGLVLHFVFLAHLNTDEDQLDHLLQALLQKGVRFQNYLGAVPLGAFLKTPARAADLEEVDPEEVETGEVETGDVDTEQVDTREVDTGEVETKEVDPEEVETGEVETGEVETKEVDPEEVDPGKTENDPTEARVSEAEEVDARVKNETEGQLGKEAGGPSKNKTERASSDGTEAPDEVKARASIRIKKKVKVKDRASIEEEKKAPTETEGQTPAREEEEASVQAKDQAEGKERVSETPRLSRHGRAMQNSLSAVAKARAHRQEVGSATRLDMNAFQRAAQAELAALKKLHTLENELREHITQVIQKLESKLKIYVIALSIEPPDLEAEALAAHADQADATAQEVKAHLKAMDILLQRLQKYYYRCLPSKLRPQKCTSLEAAKEALRKSRSVLEENAGELRTWREAGAELKDQILSCTSAEPLMDLLRLNEAGVTALLWLAERNATTIELRPLVYRHYAEITNWHKELSESSQRWFADALSEVADYDGVDAVRTTVLFLRPSMLQSILRTGCEPLARYVTFCTFAESIARRHPLFFREIWPYSAWEERDSTIGAPLTTLFKVLHRLYLKHGGIEPVLELLQAPEILHEEAKQADALDLDTVIARLCEPPHSSRKLARTLDLAADTFFRPLIPALREGKLDELEAALESLSEKLEKRELEREFFNRMGSAARTRKQHSPPLRRYCESALRTLSMWVSRERAAEAEHTPAQAENLNRELTDALRQLEKSPLPPEEEVEAGSLDWLTLEMKTILRELGKGRVPAASLAFCGELISAESLFVPLCPPEQLPQKKDKSRRVEEAPFSPTRTPPDNLAPTVSWSRWTRSILATEGEFATSGTDVELPTWGLGDRAAESLPPGAVVRWPTWDQGRKGGRVFVDINPPRESVDPRAAWPSWLHPTPQSKRLFASWLTGRSWYLEMLQDAISLLLFAHDPSPEGVAHAFFEAHELRSLLEAFSFPGFLDAEREEPSFQPMRAQLKEIREADEEARRALNKVKARFDRILAATPPGKELEERKKIRPIFPYAVRKMCCHKKSSIWTTLERLSAKLDEIEGEKDTSHAAEID